jgi:hypothetical protein
MWSSVWISSPGSSERGFWSWWSVGVIFCSWSNGDTELSIVTFQYHPNRVRSSNVLASPNRLFQKPIAHIDRFIFQFENCQIFTYSWDRNMKFNCESHGMQIINDRISWHLIGDSENMSTNIQVTPNTTVISQNHHIWVYKSPVCQIATSRGLWLE